MQDVDRAGFAGSCDKIATESLRSRANGDEIPVTSSMTRLLSLAPDRTPNFADRPRGFFIDDILAADFGPRCSPGCSCVSSDLLGNQRNLADTAAADKRHRSSSGSDSAVPLNVGTTPESDKLADGMTTPTLVKYISCN